MTNREIVSRLRELGHTVEVYVRKDGSIRVTAIDGTKYSSRLSEGVAAARDIYYREGGLTSSDEEARYQALKKQREAAQASRASGDTLRSQSKEFQAKFKKLQARIRRANKRLAKEGKRPSFNISWESTRSAAKKTNTSFEAQLNRAADYWEAVSRFKAPCQMVMELLSKLEEFAPAYPELYQFITFINEGDNKKNLDIYETRKTIDWLYGYVQQTPQSETFEERLAAFKAGVQNPQEEILRK